MEKNSKSNILYLGLQPPLTWQGKVYHYPVIEVEAYPKAQLPVISWSHLLFTSQTSVALFLQNYSLQGEIIAIGTKTKKALEMQGVEVRYCPKEESQEGLMDLLEGMDLQGAHLLYPRSARARPLLAQYLQRRKIAFSEIILYTVKLNRSLPRLDLDLFEKAIFTSPSTVEAFFTLYPHIPPHFICAAIGPVTKKTLEAILKTPVINVKDIL